MKIGYIGLGLMGGPLARNLIRAGKEVKVFDLNEESIKRTKIRRPDLLEK